MRIQLAPALLVLALSLASPLAGQSVGPVAMPEFLAETAHAEPPRLTPRSLAAALAQLPAAAVGARDQLAALERWNAAGRKPLKNGFRRALPLPRIVRLPGAPSAAGPWQGGVLTRRPGGGVVWGTRVDVDGAYRLRLHLTDVRLPAAARLWVWSDRETRGPFGAELVAAAGDLWTPSVAGGAIWIEVEIPAAQAAGRYGFTVADVMEVVRPAPYRIVSAPLPISTGCFVDGVCVPSSRFASIAQYRKAVADLDFIVGDNAFVCTGGLLNDSGSDLKPYLLTANHCISTQEVATTVEAIWDYVDATCMGLPPQVPDLPASEGSTLLATSLQSDFTLLRLSSVPAGRVFLGWNADPNAVPEGTELYRLSHPLFLPQRYSETSAARLSPISCGVPDADGRPLDDPTKFIHSVPTYGSPAPGSSGAPVVLANGQVVGQLYGGCGESVDDPCLAGTSLDQIDGAFSATFPAVAAILAPSGSTGSCVPSATTLCIDDTPGDGRFRVEVTFQQPGGPPTPGNAIPLASLGISSGGVFWFFNPGNPEVLVKVLNGCSLGGHYWVFYSAGTNVGLSTTVTDTVTGAHKTYTNPIGTAAPPVQDTSALPCS